MSLFELLITKLNVMDTFLGLSDPVERNLARKQILFPKTSSTRTTSAAAIAAFQKIHEATHDEWSRDTVISKDTLYLVLAGMMFVFAVVIILITTIALFVIFKR